MRFALSAVRPVVAFCGLVASIGLSCPARALTFNFIGNIDANARQGFVDAGNLWSAVISDNITVNINIGFSALGANILAQAGSSSVSVSYANVRTALSNDATSTDDSTAVANLQTGPRLSFVTNNPDGTNNVVSASSSFTYNTNLRVNLANARALGLFSASDSNVDASITFSSSYDYDFSHDSIDAGKYDFVGLAAHEIGHALGFVSGVDSIDLYSGPNAPNGQSDRSGFTTFSVLDLYRFSTDSVTNVVGFGKVPDLRQGGSPFFSLDKGATGSTNLFSTGPYDGDGRQASHWKDDLSLGIMDPTAAAGEKLNISELDLRAFDVIGYNRFATVVPEPTPIALFATVGMLFPVVRRRRGKRVAR